MNETENTLVIREYLLGRLDPASQEGLERRLVTDDAFLEELVIAEDELIDDFLNENLPTADRESFQSFFLSSSDRKEKLRFGRTFKKYVNSSASSLSPTEIKADSGPSLFQSILLFFRSGNTATAFSLAAALLFAVLAGILVVRERSLQAQLNDLRAERNQSVKPQDYHEGDETPRNPAAELAQAEAEIKRAQQNRQELERQIAWLEKEKRGLTPGKTSSGTSFLTPVLAMGAVRSGEGGLQEISVPSGTSVVNIPLRLPGADDGKYRATLSAEGKTLFNRGGLGPREINGQRVVLFNVPAKSLKPGEYRIRLTQATGERKLIGSYDFRIS